MGKISVEGAIDLHVHSYPSLFSRIGDDRVIVRAAAEAGMRAILLKEHYESTVSRAYLLKSEFPTIEIYGGIVLNSFVGGINPAAVEASLRMGAKAVWMPTVDAANEAQVFGSTVGYCSKDGDRRTVEGITILEENGLRAEVYEVIELVIEHKAFLGTGHLFPNEILALARGKGTRIKKACHKPSILPSPQHHPGASPGASKFGSSR